MDANDALSRLRHDLRTPLNQIIGYSELLQEETQELPSANPRLDEDLGKIGQAAKELLELINANFVPARLQALLAMSGASGAMPSAGVPPAEPPCPPGNQASAGTHFPAAAEQRATTPGRLLVVDDDEENRQVLARRLTRQGHTVETAASGCAALAMLRAPGAVFDLVMLDLLMPEMDGCSVLAAIKSDPALRALPVIMISALDELGNLVRCIECGAEDYLPKPFEPTLLRARIGASLEKKKLRDQELLHTRTVEETQQRLDAELAEAARYVRSLLPEPITSGPVLTDWRYVPSTELGGDAFGYHWITGRHFAFYLLDVSGHGVGAALLAATVTHVLRTGTLINDADPRLPGQVLTALNTMFPAERQNDLYFTLWYGVYDRDRGSIRYCSGGHPPAILLAPPEAGGGVTTLSNKGLIVGGFDDIQYRSVTCPVPPGSRLFVVSDGAYEWAKGNTAATTTDDDSSGGSGNSDRATFADLCALLASLPPTSESDEIADLDRVILWAGGAEAGTGSSLMDDLSILKVQF